MKTLTAWSAVLAVCMAWALPAVAQEEMPFADEKERLSYAIGTDIGKNFKKQGIDVDPKILAAGISDAFAGVPKMTDQQVRMVIMEFQKQMRAKMQARASKAGGANKAEGQAFLAKNKDKPGVTTLPSGLQYEVITAGDGAQPTTSSIVKVHYRGTLLDGTEFDSSYSRGEPAQFGVTGVIKGWTEALQLMNVGSKWKLYIPSDLGYGERGTGREIGPNAMLIFEVELLEIVK